MGSELDKFLFQHISIALCQSSIDQEHDFNLSRFSAIFDAHSH